MQDPDPRSYGRFGKKRTRPLPPDLPLLGFALLMVVVGVVLVGLAFPTWTQSWDRVPTSGDLQRIPYPASALEAGITGEVTARFDVEEDGRVGTIRILESSPEGVFDDAVVYGLREARFTTRRARSFLALSEATVTQRFLFQPGEGERSRRFAFPWPFREVVYGSLDVLPRKVEHVEPQFDPLPEGWGWPLIRTSPGMDGYPVEVTFTIDREGKVGFVSHGMLSRRLPTGWADEVTRAVRAWRYLPAIRDGRPVPATMTLSFLIQEPTE